MLSCSNLKMVNPTVNKNGTLESPQIYMKSLNKGKIAWVPKQDEYGSSNASTLFPSSLSQGQLLESISGLLTQNKGVIFHNLKRDQLTSFCFPKKGGRKFNVLAVLRPTLHYGKAEVITTYPVKACKAPAITVGE